MAQPARGALPALPGSPRGRVRAQSDRQRSLCPRARGPAPGRDRVRSRLARARSVACPLHASPVRRPGRRRAASAAPLSWHAQTENVALSGRVFLDGRPRALDRSDAPVLPRRAHARRVAPRPGVRRGRRDGHQHGSVDRDGPRLHASRARLHRADHRALAADGGRRAGADLLAHASRPRALRRRQGAAGRHLRPARPANAEAFAPA